MARSADARRRLADIHRGLPRDCADVVLDIGFGGGEAVVAMAADRPHEAIIGVEVHTPGVAHVLESIVANGWRHVRVVEGDVLEFLPRVPAGSLQPRPARS